MAEREATIASRVEALDSLVKILETDHDAE